MFSAASSMNIDDGQNILCAAEQINFENKKSLKKEIPFKEVLKSIQKRDPPGGRRLATIVGTCLPGLLV